MTAGGRIVTDLLASGHPCAWCDAPAVEQVVIEPTRYRMTTVVGQDGRSYRATEVAQFAIHAYVCAAHLTVRDRAGGKPVRDPRKTKAVGTVQLDIFGNEMTGPTPPPRRHPINAIKGTR